MNVDKSWNGKRFFCSHESIGWPILGEMISTCEHNVFCSVCGYGSAILPDPCDKDYYKRLGLVVDK